MAAIAMRTACAVPMRRRQHAAPTTTTYAQSGTTATLRWLPRTDNCRLAFATLVGVGLLCVMWFLFLYFRNGDRDGDGNVSLHDPLNYVILHIGDQPISMWPITHFLTYTVLGFLFPDCWAMLFVAGVLWEIIESAFAVVAQSKGHGVRVAAALVEYPYSWWAGSWKDIVFNTGGLVVGITLRHALQRALAW